MAKFRKKPIMIEAAQWFANGHCPFWAQKAVSEHGDHFSVQTLEGVMRGDPGDWIIKGVKGEIYPCKQDIFAATYDPMADATQPRVSDEWLDMNKAGYGSVSVAVNELIAARATIASQAKALAAMKAVAARNIWGSRLRSSMGRLSCWNDRRCGGLGLMGQG